MTKNEFVKRVADAGGFDRDDTYEVLRCLMDVIITSLIHGETIAIKGFGKFEVRQHSAHALNDILTGERITVPTIQYPKFTPGTTFKDAVSGKMWEGKYASAICDEQ